MTGETNPGSIGRFLDRLRLLLWTAAALGATARVLAVAAVALVLNTVVAERSAAGPWTVFAVALAGTLSILVAAVRRGAALGVPTRAAAARRAQAAEPLLRNDVESSLELSPRVHAAGPQPVSPQLIAALVGGTAARLAAQPARDFVLWRGSRSGLLLLAATLIPLAALAVTGGIPADAARALVDPRVYWPLGRVRLAVEPGDARIARGADLVVSARAGGSRPGTVLVGYEGATGEGTAAMERGVAGVFTWRFAAVTGDFRYRALARGAASPWYRVRVADAPAAGSFDVVYTAPAYSGLGVRRVAGNGDLEGLKGTTAEITFASSVELAKAALVVGANRVAVRAADDGRHRATLYLGGETAYRLELEDTEGLGNGGGPEYAIRYLPDAPPEVALTAPAGEVESDPQAAVTVRYRAADDYGLSRLTLVARAAAGERRQPLSLKTGARSAAGEFVWELAPLRAAPGDVVSAFVEAADNDTISGPKVSASAPFVVRIADPRARREQIQEAMEKLTDDLVELLGDELDAQARYEELESRLEPWQGLPEQEVAEAADRQKSAREAASRAEERAGRLAEMLDRDSSTREETLFQADLIREGLAELRERQLEPMAEAAAGLKPGETEQDEARQKAAFLATAADQAARKAEQLTLMAEAMKRERGQGDVDRKAGEMADAEDRLLESLARLSPEDRKAAQEVLSQLDRLERELRDLAEALLKESKELPEEFLNSDALKDLDLQGALDALDQVRQRLEQGDIAGARQAARELAKKLADLRNRLRQAADEVDEKVQRSLERLRGSTGPQLQSLTDRQRALLERTEALERQAGPRLEQLLREQAARRAGEPAPDAAATPGEADVLTAGERGRAEALAAEQQGLRETAQGLGAEFGALRAVLPFLPADIGRNLEEAAGQMGEAQGLLGRHEPARALPPERAALAALERANSQAQQALDQLSQMQQMRQGSSGMPMGMGTPSSLSGSGRSSDPGRTRRSGGRRGTDVRNFAIPGRQDHQVPKLFREELMKSLRDGYPLPYEERIKDYYQRIAE